MKKTFKTILLVIIFFTPVAGFAATTIVGDNINSSLVSYGSCDTPRDIPMLFDYALCVLSGSVVPFLLGLGMIIFLVGVVGYVRAGDNEEKRAAGRDLMWFGIVALFVMISVWGFVNILFNSFFGSNTKFANLPQQATSVFQK